MIDPLPIKAKPYIGQLVKVLGLKQDFPGLGFERNAYQPGFIIGENTDGNAVIRVITLDATLKQFNSVPHASTWPTSLQRQTEEQHIRWDYLGEDRLTNFMAKITEQVREAMTGLQQQIDEFTKPAPTEHQPEFKTFLALVLGGAFPEPNGRTFTKKQIRKIRKALEHNMATRMDDMAYWKQSRKYYRKQIKANRKL